MIKVEYRELTVEKQTLEELVNDNKDLIAWIGRYYGEDCVHRFRRYLGENGVRSIFSYYF